MGPLAPYQLLKQHSNNAPCTCQRAKFSSLAAFEAKA